jgi:hypothetical protein
MTVVRDVVLTVAIGDRDSDGHKLSPTEWSDFRSDMRQVLDTYGLVVAEAVGDGVGSDGPNEAVDEATCVYIVINPDSVATDVSGVPYGRMRAHVAYLARAYGQSSVCFAVDQAHEPVFTATRDGSRPIDWPTHNSDTTLPELPAIS